MSGWGEAAFRPRRVAVVGASEEPGKIGRLFLDNLARDFPGEVVPINPKRAEILGRTAYPTVRDAPGPIDLAVLLAPPAATPGVVADCAAAGVRVAVIISGGFAETGEEGRRLQGEVLARAGDTRIVGPNCFGVIDVHAGLNASLGMGMPRPGGVSLFTQSGAYGMAAFSRSQTDGIGFSKVIAGGNKADVDEVDALRFLGADPDTRVVALLLESIERGAAFVEAAREVTAHKPVVVLKTGRSRAGSRAAASHTASLAGDRAVTAAALRQAGCRLVDDGLTLLDVAATLDRQPPLPGPRVAIITNSGGTGVELTDLLGQHGLEVPQLSPALQERLRAHLPAHGSPANPVDVTPAWKRFEEMYGGCTRLLLDSGEVDAVVPVLLQRSAQHEGVVRTLCDLPLHERPVVACWVGPPDAEDNRSRLVEAGIPCLRWPAQTARVLAACRPAVPEPTEPAGPPVPRPEGQGWLPAGRTFPLLDELPVAAWRRVRGVEEAVEAARDIGYPVVLKADRADVLHKSDAGAVHLGLSDAAAVMGAFDALRAAVGGGTTLVMRQVPPGVELVLGATHDPAFGPVVMLGLGGVLVEVMGDVVLRLAPFGPATARAMLEELRGGAILDGVRGGPAVDRDALCDLVARFSHWVARRPWCAELDLNPVIARGASFAVVDARLRLEDA